MSNLHRYRSISVSCISADKTFSFLFTPLKGRKLLLGSDDIVLMNFDRTGQWLLRSHRRQKLLKQLHQPMTASQLYATVNIARRDCSDVIADLCQENIICCVNPEAHRSRLYGLTDIGRYWRKLLYPQFEQYCQSSDIDWKLYGYVCYTYRKAIILALDQPRYPADIKRYAKFCNPDIKMGTNNVHNVIPGLVENGIISKVDSNGAYPMYDLTATGRQFQHLLRKAVSNLQNVKNK